jgi:hypothetical protein
MRAFHAIGATMQIVSSTAMASATLTVAMFMVVIVMAVGLGRIGLARQIRLHQCVYTERRIAGTDGDVGRLQVGDGPAANTADDQDINAFFA